MSQKWSTLFACSWVFAHYHAARVMIQPILPVLREQAGLAYASLGLLSTGYDVGYGLTLLLCGYFADRWNRKHLICLGLIWLSLAKLATSFTSSFVSLVAWRILTGISFSTYFGAGLSLIADFFPPSERGNAMGVHAVAAGLGRSIAFPLTGILVARVGWRALFSWFSVVAVSASAVFWFFATEPRAAKPKAGRAGSNQGRALDLLKSPVLMMVGLVYCLSIACAVGEGPFLMLSLVNLHGLSLEQASLLVGVCQFTTVIFTFVATSVSDRLGRKRVLMVVFALSAVSYLLFPIAKPGVGLVLLLIFGIGDVLATTMILQTVMTEVAPPEMRGAAIGYMNTWGGHHRIWGRAGSWNRLRLLRVKAGLHRNGGHRGDLHPISSKAEVNPIVA